MIAPLWILLVLLGSMLVPASVDAAASSWDRRHEAEARLISAVDTTGTLERIPLGLQFRMKRGWKTYWRAPGEGGLPPTLDWSGSENLEAVDVAWPAPKRFSILGIESIGYEGELVLPLSARVIDPGKPLALRLTVDYLTCEEVCVPQQARLAMTLPAGATAPSAYVHTIDEWRGRVPGPPSPVLAIEGASVGLGGNAAVLRVMVSAEGPLNSPDLFVEADPKLRYGRPTLAYVGGGLARLELKVEGARDRLERLAATPATLTLVEGGRAVEQNLVLVPGPAPGLPLGLLTAFGLALLGGLVLNLMPCVLPVLSIKLLGLVGQGGAERRLARRSFLATAAGIIASFALLASAVLALQQAGAAVGWGIQFQQPWFLAALTLVVLLFAANLWGFFALPMPGWLADLGGSGPGGTAGAFMTGMLATLLATPCSAPFVGTAVGFALAGGPVEIGVVFGALGLGLASPYLLVAGFPGIATRLPRPGAWMIRLRQVLGLALAGTAGWLVWVLDGVAGPAAATAVAMLGIALLGATWLARHRSLALRAAAVLGLVAAAVLVPGFLRSAGPMAGVQDSGWVRFDRAGIDRHVREGRTVFVDVTAHWCITCRVNKAAVITRAPVSSRIEDDRVVRMRADWTRPDAEIAGYLASFGRYGIPFNAVYGPGLPGGAALPELLTSTAVIEALDRAAEAPPRAGASISPGEG